MTESERLIIIKSLTKTYGLLPVLRKIDLKINRGQFVALLGPNGSGKSTLLRLLSGVSRPTTGQIIIGGWKLPDEAAAVRVHIGVISHKSLLYETLTARENLMFFGRLYNLPFNKLQSHIDAILAQVGLSKRADQPVRTYSRGMQQRLSIARALLHEPDVLLLDEPYTGLDQDAAAILSTLLRDVHNNINPRTILMATHHLNRAVDLADRIIILNKGRISYDECTETLDQNSLSINYAQITGMAV